MSETSNAALASIRCFLPQMRAQVLAFVASRKEEGATRKEIELHAPMNVNGLNPRMKELEKSGDIVNTGRKRPQPETGRMAYVWVSAEFAPPELDEPSCDSCGMPRDYCLCKPED